MLTALTYTNAETSSVYDLFSNFIGPENLDIQTTQRTNVERNKAQQHGLWPTFTFAGGMTLHIEGQIIANDGGDYNTKRNALINALRGDPTQDAPTMRRMGTLSFTFQGESEAWNVDVTISAFSAPQIGGSPGSSAYLITFDSFVPYFIGASSGNRYFYS